ncbi:MAG: hypothetical protein AAF530_20095 [Pseudomonadota bacterium]
MTAANVLQMLQTHDDGATGICNHGDKISTVYSYLLHRHDGVTDLHVAQGRPCQSPWIKLSPPLGEAWSKAAAAAFTADYPGATAV